MLRRSIKKEGEEIGRNIGLVEGRNIGIEEKTSDIVKNMLNDKFDLKTISRITCKPLSEIREIQ